MGRFKHGSDRGKQHVERHGLPFGQQAQVALQAESLEVRVGGEGVLAASIDAAFGNHWAYPLQQDVAGGRDVHRLDVKVGLRRCRPVQVGAKLHLDNLEPVHFKLNKNDYMAIKAGVLVLNDDHIINHKPKTHKTFITSQS